MRLIPSYKHCCPMMHTQSISSIRLCCGMGSGFACLSAPRCNRCLLTDLCDYYQTLVQSP